MKEGVKMDIQSIFENLSEEEKKLCRGEEYLFLKIFPEAGYIMRDLSGERAFGFCPCKKALFIESKGWKPLELLAKTFEQFLFFKGEFDEEREALSKRIGILREAIAFSTLEEHEASINVLLSTSSRKDGLRKKDAQVGS